MNAPSFLNQLVTQSLSFGTNTETVGALTAKLAKRIDPNSGIASLEGKDGTVENYSIGNLFQEARSIFSVRKGLSDQAIKCFDEKMSQLETAFADRLESKNFKSGLKASKEVVTKTQSAFNTKSKGLPETSGLSPAKQKQLLQGLVSQAEINAADGDGKINSAKYETELTALLAKAEGLSKEGLKEPIAANTSLGLEVDAFAAIDSIDNLEKAVLHLDFENTEEAGKATDEFAKGDFSRLHPVEDGTGPDKREEVVKLLEDIDTKYQAELEKGNNPEEALARAQSHFLGKIGQMDDDQKAYFGHLSSKYQELKNSEPSDFLENLTKSLPGLVLPGLLGAAMAFLFGMSVEMGAIGFAAVSLLGGSKSLLAAPEARAKREEKSTATQVA